MKRTRTHAVLFSLEPIERLLRAKCTVPRDSVEFILVRVRTAPSGYLGSGEWSGGGSACNVAFEAVHVVLFASAIGLQDMSIGGKEREKRFTE